MIRGKLRQLFTQKVLNFFGDRVVSKRQLISITKRQFGCEAMYLTIVGKCLPSICSLRRYTFIFSSSNAFIRRSGWWMKMFGWIFVASLSSKNSRSLDESLRQYPIILSCKILTDYYKNEMFK